MATKVCDMEEVLILVLEVWWHNALFWISSKEVSNNIPNSYAVVFINFNKEICIS